MHVTKFRHCDDGSTDDTTTAVFGYQTDASEEVDDESFPLLRGCVGPRQRQL